ncbi:small, acid-soluble spore protein, alpha/beta type [Fictibacillus sp. NPDC058756]|uniref:small, acid-soluble spore protein, alpha/beta type n=1 Tax=Fictibacillus sp. NPDC058756 TaxID=3346625 RepID=UPI00367B5375
MPKNKLVVQQSEQLVNQFREEMAEEFGLYRPAAEKEAITPKLIKKQKNEKNK